MVPLMEKEVVDRKGWLGKEEERPRTANTAATTFMTRITVTTSARWIWMRMRCASLFRGASTNVPISSTGTSTGS